MIRNVKIEDIKNLATIYKELYDDANIEEFWTIESAENLLMYWFNKQKDLFFVAIENNEIIGAIMSGIKPWFDGNRLIDTELFVSKKYQGKHIARQLLITLLTKAKEIYNVNVMEFHTYGNEEEFPQAWYNKIGFKKDNELVIMNGNIEKVLNKIKL